MWWLVSIISFLLALTASFNLLKQRYLRLTSLGWLIAIICIPLFGALAYFVVVVRSHQQRLDGLSCPLPYANQQLSGIELDDAVAQLHGFQMAKAVSDVQVLQDDEFLPALLSVINNAERSIALCTYILSGDVKGQVLEALAKASQRGVQVFCLVDRIGSALFRSRVMTLAHYKRSNFHAEVYHAPIGRSILFAEKRLHSKILVVDGEVGFLGAHNLRDAINSSSPNFVHNLSVSFTGPVVRDLLESFAELWRSNSGEAPAALIDELRHERPAIKSAGLGRIIYGDPIVQHGHYHEYLHSLLFSARKRLYIWMPYVIPSQGMRSNIIAAHKMGVDVKILMPKKSDSWLVDNAHALVINEWVDAGVPLAVGSGHFDHSKVLVIDDRVIVGSTNLDYRSLHRNHETNIELYPCDASRQIEQAFLQRFHDAEFMRCVEVNKFKTLVQQATSLIAGLY